MSDTPLHFTLNQTTTAEGECTVITQSSDVNPPGWNSLRLEPPGSSVLQYDLPAGPDRTEPYPPPGPSITNPVLEPSKLEPPESSFAQFDLLARPDQTELYPTPGPSTKDLDLEPSKLELPVSSVVQSDFPAGPDWTEPYPPPGPPTENPILEPSKQELPQFTLVQSDLPTGPDRTEPYHTPGPASINPVYEPPESSPVQSDLPAAHGSTDPYLIPVQFEQLAPLLASIPKESHAEEKTSSSSSDFNTKKPKLRKIMVMGLTGSGKSTFINTVSDSSLPTSDSLGSCTAEIRLSKSFQVKEEATDKDYTVKLVDTPGFNDTTRSDTEVLGMIGDWMKESYDCKRELAGIIYCHRITDNRFDGSAMRGLQLFGDICGKEFRKNVILVTTMWSQSITKQETERERQLIHNFWNKIISSDNIPMRHLGTRETGHDIIARLLKEDPATPAFQKELAVHQQPLGETTPGKALMAEIIAMEKEHQDNLEAAHSEFDMAKAASNKVMLQVMAEEIARQQAALQNVQNDRDKLSAHLGLRVISKMCSAVMLVPKHLRAFTTDLHNTLWGIEQDPRDVPS